MADIIEALNAEIVLTEKRLAALKESRDRLQNLADGHGVLDTIHASAAPTLPVLVEPQQFAMVDSLGGAVREYLTMKPGHSASLTEIMEAMKAGNAQLGKYPKRSVKLAVVNNSRWFSLEDGIVHLKIK